MDTKNEMFHIPNLGTLEAGVVLSIRTSWGAQLSGAVLAGNADFLSVKELVSKKLHIVRVSQITYIEVVLNERKLQVSSPTATANYTDKVLEFEKPKVPKLPVPKTSHRKTTLATPDDS